ncbi:MAG: RDD family protein [Halanaerobiales bacterium]
MEKVDFLPRFLAALIDGAIAWVPVFIPIIGGIISVLYLLCKDGVMYQITRDDNWKNTSIGKKALKLEVVHLEGEDVDLKISAKRNIPLTIGSFIAIIPVLGWLIGPIVAVIAAMVELIMYVTDKDGRRLGDRWANTMVVAVPEVETSKEIGS